MTKGALPPGTHIGTVRLRVRDLERTAAFYRDVLRLVPVEGREPDVAFGAGPGGRPLLVLQSAPDARPAPPRSTGLFHVALLYPTRRALAEAIVRVRDARWSFQGFADHAVSEAAYLADPEGNGLELYADRPRETWPRHGSDYELPSLPLDVLGLIGEARTPGADVPETTHVGHIHLRVSSLAAAERFYVGRVGFEVTARAVPGALFVSAAGYHHHMGLNTWAGVGAPAPPPGSLGLESFEIVVPGADEGTVRDPDGVDVRIVAA